MRHIKTGLLASFLFVLLAACDRPPQELRFTGNALGTSYSVKVVDHRGELAGAGLPERVREILDDLDLKFSTYKSESELNRLNRQPPGEAFVASDDLYQVLVIAQRIYRISAGAFDPTVRPLVDLWGFGPPDSGDRVPTDAEISSLLNDIGFEKIELGDDNRIVRRSGVTLDLSAVAKGYIVDRLAEALMALGATDLMVEVGGEIRVGGRRADGRPWRIAVEVPSDDVGGVERILELRDVGVATSGNYRNYFEREGVRYSHTIDPRTGRPVAHRLVSATVIAATAAEADAVATALMVLGDERGLEFARDHELAVLLLVYQGDDFVEVSSPQMAAYLQ